MRFWQSLRYIEPEREGEAALLLGLTKRCSGRTRVSRRLLKSASVAPRGPQLSRSVRPNRSDGVRNTILVFLIGLSFATAVADDAKPVTATEKREFLALVRKLPTEGEFFTEKAIRKAAPHMRVLFALTEQDLEQDDIYPLAALSTGLCRDRKYRQYGVEHFSDLAHPSLKLFWAAALFGAQPPLSTEVVAYLRSALESEAQSRELREIVGPNFESFKERVIQAQANKN
jgi:hypothetical protein